MMKPNSDVVYVFIHIPKTAGQTLKKHFIKHLEHHTEFIHLGPSFGKDKEKGVVYPGFSLGWEKRCVEDRLRAKVILGHVVRYDIGRLLPGRSIEFITFLRDPVSRWVSDYNFQMKREGQPIDFFKWYEIRKKGLQSNYHLFHLYNFFLNKSDSKVCKLVSLINRHGFSSDGINKLLHKYKFLRVANVLKQFRYVGLVDRFEEDSQKIMQLLGLPQIMEKFNVSGRHHKERQEVTDEIRQSLTPDCWWDYKLIEIVKKMRNIS